MTVSDSFDKFISSKKLADLSPKSIGCYEEFIGPFITFIGPTLSLDALTRDLVDSYLSSIVCRDISKATKATYIRHIKVFLKWVEFEYSLSLKSSTIAIPKTPKKMLRIYNEDEIRIIFDSVQAEAKWLVLRNSSIIALMLDSGLRQNEVCCLKRAHCQFKDNIIKVLGKGNKERIVPMGRTTAYYLHEYMNSCPYESEILFLSRRGEALTCDAVKHMMYKMSLELPFEYSSHKLRHNFATNYCLDQYRQYHNIDVYRLMILMGHEDIETTKRYLHIANQIIATQTNISHIDMIYLEKMAT